MQRKQGIPVIGRTREVLNAIGSLTVRGGPITSALVTNQTGMKRQNVRKHLLKLLDRGLIDFQRGGAAGRVSFVTLSAAGLEELGLVVGRDDHEHAFPVLGEVAAGQPVLADSVTEVFAVRLAEVLDMSPGDFLLRVRGESMIGIGIFPGDLVAIHPGQNEPAAGTITLVSVPGDNTATLKRWQRRNGTVTLHSENPLCPPMTFRAADVQIQGYFIGHIGTGRSRSMTNFKV